MCYNYRSMKHKYLTWIDKNINKPHLVNKTILITGGNSGIGLAVAKYCSYLKMNIIITVRNKFKGEKAIKEIKSEYKDINISYLLLDTSSLKSIKEFAKNIIDNRIDIDCFYNNAGTFRLPKDLTNDGFDRVIETNYIGPFMLTVLLKPYFESLNHKVKIICTTSVTAKRAKINYEDIKSITSTSKYNTYAESKLFNVHLYLSQKEECKNTNIIPLLVHPGVTATPIILKAYPKWFANIAIIFMKMVFHSASKAALSTIALLDDSINEPVFYGPRGIYNVSGYPKENKITKHMKKDFLATKKVTKNLLNLY